MSQHLFLHELTYFHCKYNLLCHKSDLEKSLLSIIIEFIDISNSKYKMMILQLVLTTGPILMCFLYYKFYSLLKLLYAISTSSSPICPTSKSINCSGNLPSPTIVLTLYFVLLAY